MRVDRNLARASTVAETVPQVQGANGRWALEVRQVGKNYHTYDGAIEALSDITFTVQPGEFVAVIGPSGCGKTTLFNIIGGLLADFSGDVFVDHKSVRSARGSVGMVFQEESTFPWRTTLENVAFALEVAGMPKRERLERAQHFLRLVGLDGFESRFPSELSGGMRQRTALARTLAFQPKVLLLDEPFAALDSQTRILVGDKVLKIQQELAQTTLLITHNLTEAVQLADRVIVLTYRPGRIKRTIDVDLPRPRGPEVLESERFGQLVAALWHDLREEAAHGISDSVTAEVARKDGRVSAQEF